MIKEAVIFKMIPYDRHYLKSLAAGLASTAVFAAAKLFAGSSLWPPFLFGGVGLVLYALILRLFGLPEDDRTVLKAVKNKIGRVRP